MLYNKNRFSKANDKKILHKVKKQWVTISVALFALIGGGALASHVNALANTTDNNNDNSNNINRNQNNNANQSNTKLVTSPQPTLRTSQNSNVSNLQNIKQGAQNLHNNILTHAMIQNSTNTYMLSMNSNVKKAINNQKSIQQPIQQRLSNYSIGKSVLNDENHNPNNNWIFTNDENHNPNYISDNQVTDWKNSIKPYYGLNYRYSPSHKAVEFTNGVMTWNGDGSEDTFIGTNSDGSDAHSVSNIPLSDILSIKFDSDIDTSHVTNLNWLVYHDKKIRSIDLGNFNTSKATIMRGTFGRDDDLVHLNLGPNFNTSKVSDMSDMFSDDNSLPQVTLPKGFNTLGTTDLDELFSKGWHGYGYHSQNVGLQVLKIASPDAKFSNVGLPSMYEITGSDDPSGKPYTLPTANDFSKGNVGTFVRDKNPTPNLQYSDIYGNVDGLTAPRSTKDINQNQINTWTYVNAHGQISKDPLSMNGKILVAPVYHGLTYKYNKSNKNVDFVNGSLTWNGTENSGSDTFIGRNSDNNDIHSIQNIPLFNILSIKFDSDIDTSHVTNMNWLIYNDPYVKSIVLNNFNTNKVTRMRGSFGRNENLNHLDLGTKFDTSNTSDIDSMFSDDLSLSLIKLPSVYSTKKVNSMTDVFSAGWGGSDSLRPNSDLRTLVIQSPDTKFSKSANLPKMYKVTGYDNEGQPYTLPTANDFSKGNVGTFIRKINKSIGTVHYIDTTNGNQIKFAKVSNTYDAPGFSNSIKSMFNNLPSGYELDNNYHYQTNLKEMNNLPNNYPEAQITNYNIYVKPVQKKVTDTISYHDIYSNIDGLSNPISTTVTGSSNDNYSVKSPQGWAIVNNQGQTINDPSFKYDAGNQTINVAPVYDGLTYKYNNNNKSIEFTGGKLTWNGHVNDTSNSDENTNGDAHYTIWTSFIGSGDNAPSYINNVQSIKFDNGVDVSNVSDMSGMFANNHYIGDSKDYGGNFNIKSIDLGNNFDTSNVKDMKIMFADCTAKSINLGPKFNTNNVTDMGEMFFWNQNLKSLNFGPNFDTGKVTNMQKMFMSDNSLQQLTLPNTFNTSKVTNMSDMFGTANDNPNKALQLLTIQSPNTKFNNYAILPEMYKIIGYIQNKPYTVTNPNNFNQGNVGTFVRANPLDIDRIIFNGDLNANTTKKGMKGTQSSINAPQGYHYINNSTGKFTFDNGIHTFYVAPNIYTHTDNVQYQDNGVTKTTQDFTGNIGNSFDVNNSNANIPAGYRLVKLNNRFSYNDNYDIVPITRKQGTDNITFVLKDTNNQIGTSTVSGNLNSDYTVQSNQIPNDNYHLVDDGTQTFKIMNGQNHNVDVLPNIVTDSIHFNGDNSADTAKQGIINTDSSASAPNGYHYINNSNGHFTFNNGIHTFDVARNQHTDNVQYQLNGITKASQNFTGNTDSNFDVTSSDANIPSNYKLVNPDNRFNYNDNNDVVPIALKQDTNTVNFINKKNGQKIGSTQVNGNDGSSDTVSSDQVPSDYHLANDGTQTFKLTPNGEHNVNVLPNPTPAAPKSKNTAQPKLQKPEPKSQKIQNPTLKKMKPISKPSTPLKQSNLPQTGEKYNYEILSKIIASLSLGELALDSISEDLRKKNNR